MTHTFISDFELTLTHPDGTSFKFFDF